MSQARRLRRQQTQPAQYIQPAPQIEIPQQPVLHAPLWLSAAFLIPNLGAIAGGFVFDDRVLIAENQSLHVHSLSQLLHIWKAGYWPDNRGLELYRPVAQTVWALLWAAGNGSPALFHTVGLALGLAAVLLLYRLFLAAQIPPLTAFLAAALFALFPIHTDATASVAGSAELMAAAFSLGALLFYYQNRPIPALILFGLAVFSKESAAAFAALPLAFPNRQTPPRNYKMMGAGAAIIIAAALAAHQAVSRSSLIPPIDNPAALLDSSRRILTALWVQCLYVFKTVAPLTLSADYSYKQLPLVMGLDDGRALAGLALAGGAIFLLLRRPQFRAPILAYAILFSPTANVLFPIGTIMGERLAYAPTLGIALLLGILLARTRYWKPVLIGVAVVFAARTAVRNVDWRNPHNFYYKLLETSPESAKSHYSIGVLLAANGDDEGAVAAYTHAIDIFPAYAEAFRNRGNALARLGRGAEAMASYQQCLRFDPGDYAANTNLRELQAGRAVYPPRAHP